MDEFPIDESGKDLTLTELPASKNLPEIPLKHQMYLPNIASDVAISELNVAQHRAASSNECGPFENKSCSIEVDFSNGNHERHSCLRMYVCTSQCVCTKYVYAHVSISCAASLQDRIFSLKTFLTELFLRILHADRIKKPENQQT